MIAIYPYVEFLHVAAVVLWLGGGSVCIFSAMKADRADSAADFTRVLADTVFFANWLFVPAALVAFAAGLTMAYLGELLSELWIWIGVSGFAITFLTGLLVIKPRAEKLLAAIKSGPSAEVFGPGREIVRIAKFDYVVLFTVAANMVLKPGPADSLLLAVMAAVVVAAGAMLLAPVFRAAPQPAQG